MIDKMNRLLTAIDGQALERETLRRDDARGERETPREEMMSRFELNHEALKEEVLRIVKESGIFEELAQELVERIRSLTPVLEDAERAGWSAADAGAIRDGWYIEEREDGGFSIGNTQWQGKLLEFGTLHLSGTTYTFIAPVAMVRQAIDAFVHIHDGARFEPS